MRMIDDLGSRAESCRMFKGVGVELGVNVGIHAAQMLKHAPTITELTLIDGWSHWPKFDGETNRLEQTMNRVAEWRSKVRFIDERSPAALDRIPDGSLDFIYIDAGHEYENVRADIIAAIPKVKSYGIISGHDFRVTPKAWGVGVCAAVIESIQDGDMKMIGLSNEQFSDWFCEKC